jgi:hypothetical protein
VRRCGAVVNVFSANFEVFHRSTVSSVCHKLTGLTNG